MYFRYQIKRKIRLNNKKCLIPSKISTILKAQPSQKQKATNYGTSSKINKKFHKQENTLSQ